MNKPNRIFIHCSATTEGKDFTADDIDRWHRARGWSGIGYHKVVRLDGTVERGRADTTIGAHVRGHNTNSLGIVYIGGVGIDGKPKDTRTPMQHRQLVNEVLNWMEMYDIPVRDVYGHYEFAAKACPSFDMEYFRAELWEALEAKDEALMQETDEDELDQPVALPEPREGPRPFWQAISDAFRHLFGGK
jgi:N-acetylmuramoyl-L-alanine amidase